MPTESQTQHSIFSECQLCTDHKNESVKQSFLSAISHEFKTPLTNLLGFSDILLAKKQNQEEQKLLTDIQQEGEKLLRLINEALHAREQNKQAPEMQQQHDEPFSLNILCKKIEEPYQLRCKNKHLGFFLKNHFENRQDLFCGDHQRLRLILENLLDNAIQQTENGSIELEFGGQYQQTPFFFSINVKQNNATRAQSRSMPDLYTCQRLLRKMGGRLHMESEMNEPVRFWAELPLKGSTTEPVAKNQAQPSKPRLLIVDDMEEMHLLLKFYLRGSDCLLDFAHNGKQAVEMHQQQPYQIIIMDMRMPIMDGLEATQQIRLWEAEQQRTASTIIALTADHNSRQHCLSTGCDELLTKPVQRQRLIDLITISLSQASQKP
ncbi:MAG: response regulator [Gammaproteobacteria bacterium]|nr:response regulator [Gammaproteobacteria bacterium]